MAFLPRNLRNAIGRWGAALILVGKRNNTTFAGMSSVRKRTQMFFFAPLGSDFSLNGLLTGH